MPSATQKTPEASAKRSLRPQYWALIVVLLAYCSYYGADYLRNPTQQSGAVEVTSGDGLVAEVLPIKEFEPKAYYEFLHLSPSDDDDKVRLFCNGRLGRYQIKEDHTPAELAEKKKVLDACDTLTVDYRRCHYDAEKGHRDGLWHGYRSMCDHLRNMAEWTYVDARLARKRKEAEQLGMTGSALTELLAKTRLEYEASDVRMEGRSRRRAEEDLMEEQVQRFEKDQKAARDKSEVDLESTQSDV